MLWLATTAIATPAASTLLQTDVSATVVAPDSDTALERTRNSQESPTNYVELRLRKFFDPLLGTDARFEAAKELAKFANGWIEATQVPIPQERLAETEAIAKIVKLLAEHSSTRFDPSKVGPFQGRWLRLVEADLAAGGPFGQQHYWRELNRRLWFLAFHGQLASALELVGSEGDFSVEAAPAPWRTRLISVRADIHRLQGHFEEALADLEMAANDRAASGPRERLMLASVEFKVETGLGRLDRAEAALLDATRVIGRLGGEATPLMQNQLWRLRINQLLSNGQHAQALATARARIEEHGAALATTITGIRALDYLRYQAFRAAKACNWEELGPEDRAFASLETAAKLSTVSHLDQFRKSSVAIDRIALLHARGKTEEALQALRSLRADEAAREASGDESDSDSISWVTSEAPVLALRLAALRFMVTLQVGDCSDQTPAREELHEAYARLLEVWRSVALQPSGIGFLEFFERRRALNAVLQSVLGECLDQPDRALAYVLAADNCSTVARRLGVHELTPTDVVELCKESNATLVYVVPTPEATHRFIISAKGVEHQLFEGEAEFQARFRPLLRALRTRPNEESSWPPASIRPQVNWLAERLVPANPGKKVLYAGLDALGFAPVEVLPGPDGQPIGLTRVVGRVPSVSALKKWRTIGLRRASGGTTSMSLFAVTGGGMDAKSKKRVLPIPFGVAEYATLVRATAGAQITYVADAEGTEQRFLDSLMAGPDLFIAMTHGASNSPNAGTPGIFVRGQPARGGNGAPELAVLTAESIGRSLQVTKGERPLVALLAACGAGAGPRRTGDSRSSDFSGSLLANGIAATLTASEEVEADAAIAYLTAFSSAFLGSGQTAGEATLAARQAVQELKGKNHPHYWAPLQLHGWSDIRLK